jgi:hypothetical protein
LAIVVVGGQTRNIGKTSVVAGLIARLPELRWTAFKITQFGHGFCTADGKPCACQTADACVSVSADHDAASGTDSSRFLAAGAARSIWVRTRIGMLAEAMPRIREEIGKAEHAILESNSVLEFLQPDLYLTVLDPGVVDFKDSARRWLERADAVLWSSRGESGIGAFEVGKKAQFAVGPPEYVTGELVDFVRARVVATVRE